MFQIPILMITYNRLEFTKRALEALFAARNTSIYIIDNGSTDGTVEWLKSQPLSLTWDMTFLEQNIGVAGAMNLFLSFTRGHDIIGKVDNDTIIPEDFVERMLPHLQKADIVQAKHPILKATHAFGFDSWTANMTRDGALRFHHFVGGSGILFKANMVDQIPATEWKIYGWRQWQKDHPEVKKAFATDVEIELLDMKKEGGDNYPLEYESYYKETKRL